MFCYRLLFIVVVIFSAALVAGPTHKLAREKKWDDMLDLIYGGADVNAREEATGLTVLDIALELNSYNTVNALLREGGQPSVMLSIAVDDENNNEVCAVEPAQDPEADDSFSSEDWPSFLETPLGTASPIDGLDDTMARMRIDEEPLIFTMELDGLAPLDSQLN